MPHLLAAKANYEFTEENDLQTLLLTAVVYSRINGMVRETEYRAHVRICAGVRQIHNKAILWLLTIFHASFRHVAGVHTT